MTCVDCLASRGIKIPEDKFVDCPDYPTKTNPLKWRISMELAESQAVCDDTPTGCMLSRRST